MTAAIRLVLEAAPFQRTIVAIIVLAGVVAGLETSPAIMARHGDWLSAADRLILGAFVIEALLKMAVHGRQPWRYFADGWNVFDFVIVVLCLLPVAGPFAAVLRLARALRLLRLVSALPKLQLLVGGLLRSLSSMGYVSLLLAMLFYIYGVAGYHLLGVADPENFGSLSASLMSLFRIVTLDNWGDLFQRAIERVPGVMAVLYFVTFIVFGTMIILNLFIGIIMNSMAEVHAEQEKAADLAKDRASSESDALARLSAAADQLAGVQKQLSRLREELRRNQPEATGAVRGARAIDGAEAANGHRESASRTRGQGSHPGPVDSTG